MREYRGKRVDNGEWVSGYYFVTPLTDEATNSKPEDGWYFLTGRQRHCISRNHCVYEVDPGTVGQYTGLEDKNGKEIYKDDILSYKRIVYTNCSKTKIEEIKDEVFIEIITYNPMASVVKPHSPNVKCFGWDTELNNGLMLDITSGEVEIISNLHDNPELPEVR